MNRLNFIGNDNGSVDRDRCGHITVVGFGERYASRIECRVAVDQRGEGLFLSGVVSVGVPTVKYHARDRRYIGTVHGAVFDFNGTIKRAVYVKPRSTVAAPRRNSNYGNRYGSSQ